MQGSTEASTSKVHIEDAAAALGHSDDGDRRARKPATHKHSGASWNDILRSGLAGALAGCIAKTSVGALQLPASAFAGTLQVESPSYFNVLSSRSFVADMLDTTLGQCTPSLRALP